MLGIGVIATFCRLHEEQCGSKRRRFGHRSATSSLPLQTHLHRVHLDISKAINEDIAKARSTLARRLASQINWQHTALPAFALAVRG